MSSERLFWSHLYHILCAVYWRPCSDLAETIEHLCNPYNVFCWPVHTWLSSMTFLFHSSTISAWRYSWRSSMLRIAGPKNWCLWLTPYPLFTPRNQGSDGTRDALVCIAKVYRNPRYMQLLLASETTSATNYWRTRLVYPIAIFSTHSLIAFSRLPRSKSYRDV